MKFFPLFFSAFFPFALTLFSQGQPGFITPNVQPYISKPMNFEPLYQYQQKRQEIMQDVAVEENRRENAAMVKNAEEANYCISKINSIYNNASNFPSIIKDGWYNVYSYKENLFCANMNVKVQDNKIIKIKDENQDQTVVTYSSTIKAAKAIIEIKILDTSQRLFIDILFLNEIK